MSTQQHPDESEPIPVLEPCVSSPSARKTDNPRQPQNKTLADVIERTLSKPPPPPVSVPSQVWSCLKTYQENQCDLWNRGNRSRDNLKRAPDVIINSTRNGDHHKRTTV
ncbi:hypothetical protein N7530_003161 [Penicillium desertorum]|uniref:Uncharacterized protein n=1 Tax=Penicillium desertorum TaxID=1303715 RepID=A0A9X0BPI6_9EURO|nr:hypothetical protein N7530_003161 [Penicillium desertorum]